MDEQNFEELFQLQDGRYIVSQEVSDRMFKLKQIRPEAFQSDSDGYAWDENGMAQLFSELYGDGTRFCPEKKSWYTYHDGCWRMDKEGILVSSKIREFVRLMVLYCGEIVDSEKRTEFLKFVLKMGDRRFRDRMQKDARDNLAISATEFDNNPYLINCLNGTYDLERLVFREHDPHDYLTMQTAFDFSVQRVSCPRWEQFIDEVTCKDKKKARYLQKALGYSILGTSKEECMFILHGKTTRNGKSTLLGTIQHMLGDYAATTKVSIICKTDRAKNAEAASPTLARLKGKRFVTMAESNQYGKFDEEQIKQLTGGEEITARNLYESEMSFLPQFTLWLSCNDLPAVSDKSLFASDRVRVIEFNRHFTAEERDPDLKDFFMQPDSMMGIFDWLVTGYVLYKREGLKMPPEMQKVVNQYERDNDLVLQFLEEKCETKPDGGISSKTLYEAFKVWCRSNGFYVCSSKKFTSDVLIHPDWYFSTHLRENRTVFDGLVLKV